MKKSIAIITVLISLWPVWVGAREGKISSSLGRKIAQGGASEPCLCWVFFSDKGPGAEPPVLCQDAAERRAKVGREMGYGDLPVYGPYVEEVRRTGAEVRVTSPWLNAISVKAYPAQISLIEGIGRVERIDRLLTMKRPAESVSVTDQLSKSTAAVDYGSSQTQIQLMKVDQLQQKGYSGKGVKLTIIDTGFDRWHESLLRVRVIAERDFQRSIIDTIAISPLVTDTLPDTITWFEPAQDISLSQTWHGTGMLSIAGAYQPGTLIGSAYNADFILAKTEMYFGDDFQQEEDWFVAAVQWATDSLGTDIISSSLGYRFWSDTVSYSYSQMDGRTAACSRAADSATARGVVFLNSLGNIGNNLRPDTCLVVPADAEGVISVGGVWPITGLWASPAIGNGTVTGPAADSVRILPPARADSAFIRRIKPDIASCWQNYYAYNEPDGDGNYNRYASSVGTSGATVLTAGLCALLLEAHPSWGPDEVLAALRSSGSNRSTVEAFFGVPESLDITLGTYPGYNPGFSGIATGHKYYTSNGVTHDLYDVYRLGWGVPDGIEALYHTAPEVVFPEVSLPEKDQLLDPYPNPVKAGDGGVHLPFYLVQDSYEVTIRIYSLDGRLVRRMELGSLLGSYPIPFERDDSRRPAFWDLKDYRGAMVPSGLYIALLTTGWNQSSRKIMVLR